jgi:UDP:flavonoid glycosyltransferase YjiC (YdhE family)
MATVIFAVPPMASPIYASLKLARELNSRGHRVLYVGIPDCEDFMAPDDLDFVPVFGDWFPKGYLESRRDGADLSWDERRASAKKRSKQFNGFFESLISGANNDWRRTLTAIEPDLVVIPSCTYYSVVWALLTHEIGIKCLYLSYTFGCSPNSGHPPVTTSLIPVTSAISRLRTKMAWKKLSLRRSLFETVFSRLGFSVNWSQTIKRLARKCKYPAEHIEFSDLSSPKLRFPELFLCPRELDFPGGGRTGRFYAEASIDLRRREVAFPWEKIDDSRPLVYCSLGTLQYLKREQYRDFFRKALIAAALRPERQWVISIGDLFSVEEFSPAPKNVVIVNRAPQLEILKRASVMISHGGMNSVKESIFFGVPMLIFPLGFDEPGNAARIVYHRLGLSGDIRAVSVERILDMLGMIGSDPIFRARAALMSKSFQQSEVAGMGVKFIESLIG